MTWHDSESCTFPRGFLASGVHCGIKKTAALDLALLVSERSSVAAGVFTQNAARAACIDWNEKILSTSPAEVRALVINSGNANAVTGTSGIQDNAFMASETARLNGCLANQVLVGSTGVIGVKLPMLNVEQGIQAASVSLHSTGGLLAAEAIMTTDTKPKFIARETLDGYRLGGMAKGAGMIHPNMATLISVITTDAIIPTDTLQRITRDVADKTFNCISIDGDTSTNDMFVVLANGASGVEPDMSKFADELEKMAMILAHKIVRDAEGVSRFVEIRVTHAQSAFDARTIARTISTSLLFKTALFGADPNWGRVLAAAGRAGVSLNVSNVTLSLSGLLVLKKGEVVDFDEALAHEKLKSPEVLVELDLGQGFFASSAYTSDLTHDYIRINSSYRS